MIKNETWEGLRDVIDALPWWLRLTSVAAIALVFAGMAGAVDFLV